MQEQATIDPYLKPDNPPHATGLENLPIGGPIQIGDIAVRGAIAIDGQEVDRSDELTELDARIQERVNRASVECDFGSSPELDGALEGFYTDHYYLYEAIEAVVAGDYDNPIFARILEGRGYEPWEINSGKDEAIHNFDKGRYRPAVAPNTKIYAMRLARFLSNQRPSESDVERYGIGEGRLKALRICGTAVHALFSESSVGISTIDDDEIDMVARVADDVRVAANEAPLFELGTQNYQNFSDSKQIRSGIKAAKKEFWSDVRHAGQLEFHGSGDLGPTNVHGLMSRNQQVRTIGEMRVQTALNFNVDTMHSVVPHFSEFYSGEYNLGDRGGTVAVPLKSIIEVAPYGRDAMYGMLRPKNEDTEARIPKPTLDIPVAQVGAGSFDFVSSRGFDRTFFASADETSETLPDDYSINLHRKGGKPATYIIDKTSWKHQHPDRDLDGLGYGDGFPERLVIEKGESVEAKITELQREYLEAYKGHGVVVPLRRGVFAQQFEGMATDQGNGRPSPQIYNRYDHGTRVIY